jgi:hypothetical protein
MACLLHTSHCHDEISGLEREVQLGVGNRDTGGPGLHTIAGAGGLWGYMAQGQGYQRQFTALPATTVWHLAATLMVLPVAEHTWRRELPCAMPRANVQEHNDSEEEASMSKVSRPRAAHGAAQRHQCSASGLAPPMQGCEEDDEDLMDDAMDDTTKVCLAPTATLSAAAALYTYTTMHSTMQITAPPGPAALPPTRAPLRDVTNQPLMSNYLAPGAQFKRRAVQQNLDSYFTSR